MHKIQNFNLLTVIAFRQADEMAQIFRQRIAQAEAMARADMLRFQPEVFINYYVQVLFFFFYLFEQMTTWLSCASLCTLVYEQTLRIWNNYVEGIYQCPCMRV